MDSPVHSERPRAPRAEPTSASARAHGIPDIEMQMAMRAVMAGMLGRVRDVHIGRYVVRRRLGHGGCGLVLLADDPELGREVAIKVVLPTRDRDERGTAWQKALQREAQALAKLRHPNVVAVHDVEGDLRIEVVDIDRGRSGPVADREDGQDGLERTGRT